PLLVTSASSKRVHETQCSSDISICHLQHTALSFKEPDLAEIYTLSLHDALPIWPDAPNADDERGPMGYVEWQVTTEPIAGGWPYCHGPNDGGAYNEWDFENEEPEIGRAHV